MSVKFREQSEGCLNQNLVLIFRSGINISDPEWQFLSVLVAHESVLVAHDCNPAIGGQEQGMV